MISSSPVPEVTFQDDVMTSPAADNVQRVNEETSSSSNSPRLLESIRMMFSFDLRSLALYRIALSTLILTDLVLRAKCLLRDYSDLGLLPRHVASAAPQYSSLLSLHHWGGAPYAQALLFLVAGGIAIMMLFGIHTWRCQLATWLLLVSLQARNPLILHSGDVLMTLLVFWGLFLPLGERFSWDRRPDRGKSQAYFGMGTVAFIAQVSIVYFSSAWAKIKTDHWRDGSAVGNALKYDYVVTPFGLWLRQFGEISPVLTYGTLILEFLAPLLLLFPYRNSAVRLVTVLALWTAHFAFGMCFEIGLFPWICFVMLCPFLPASYWIWLQSQFKNHSVAMRSTALPGSTSFISQFIFPTIATRDQGSLRAMQSEHKTEHLPGTGWLSGLICASGLGWVVLWNLGKILGSDVLPETLTKIGVRLGLAQNWSVFVDKNVFNGWYVIDGICRDGSHVDLLNRQPLSWDKPAIVSSRYDSYRMRLYLERIARKGYADFREPYAEYLRNSWNSSHPSNKAIDTIGMYYVINQAFEKEQHNFPDAVLLYLRDWRNTAGMSKAKQHIREHLP